MIFTYLSRADLMVSLPFAHPPPSIENVVTKKQSPQTSQQLQNRLTYVYNKFKLREHIAAFMHANYRLFDFFI